MIKFCYLLLGSNKGNSLAALEKAKFLCIKTLGPMIAQSKLYKTEPWGEKDQQIFLNQIILIETELTCYEVLASTQKIEGLLGKQKTTKYGPRVIDIDILFYNDEIYEEKNLEVPHPRLHERNFTLIPLAEIAGHYIHPVFNKTIEELVQECTDNSEVIVLNANEQT